MLVLALDTATPTVSVAVTDVSGQRVSVLSSQAETDARRHAELLAPMVSAALAEASCRAVDLDRVVVGVGPGPFTGLRVGITTAVTLGFAVDAPVQGICSLDALAAAAEVTECVVVTDARRREVYWARYERGRRVSGPAVDYPDVVAEAIAPGVAVVGPGRGLLPDTALSRADTRAAVLRAQDLVVALTQGAEVLAPQPLYLRRPDAVVPGTPKPVSAAGER
ncbi:MAG: tRNA (adenosine(37)-N6)-threonylcarbamoyltransferase complex dimerization subunit type 1 TsaB [Actinomycetes bacterium]